MPFCFLFEEGRPILQQDRAKVEGYFRRFPPVISEMTFTNLFAWAETRHTMLCERDGHLVVSFRDHRNCLSLFPPIGGDPVGMMQKGVGGASLFHWNRVPEEWAQRLVGAPAMPDAANHDYVYRLSDLRELRGKKYDGKRLC